MNTTTSTIKIKSTLSRLLLASLMLTLTGCMRYYVDPDTVSQYKTITTQSLQVPFQPVYLTELPRELSLQPESQGLPKVGIRHAKGPAAYGLHDGVEQTGILTVLTLSLYPGTWAYDKDHFTLDYFWKGNKIAATRQTFAIRKAFSMFFPTPMLFPDNAGSAEGALAKAYQATIPGHRAELENLVRVEQNYIRANVDLNDPESVSSYLSSRDANPLTPTMTHQLASLAPEDDPLSFHRRYLAKNYQYYKSMVSREDLPWLIGPEGLSGYEIRQSLNTGQQTVEDVIATMADQWLDDRNSNYRKLTYRQRKSLLAGGLPPEIVDRMDGNDPDYARAEIRKAEEARKKAERLAKKQAEQEKKRQLAEQRKADARAQLEQLAIKNNSGQYMSPYTSDGVTAEWVNQAINANIGATAGGAVGTAAGMYAANKALESVPFGSLLAGAIGNEVGKTVGREAAIEASGGWDHIRKTSDMSFRSLSDMARYLKAVYGNESTFSDAMAATTQVYPEFADALAR